MSSNFRHRQLAEQRRAVVPRTCILKLKVRQEVICEKRFDEI